MSPVGVRRWRAERLLRVEFEALRGRVLAAVRVRLRSSAGSLAALDLDACYAQAWQGLYSAVLAGEEIENPAGWLVVVTHRRALDELRALARASRPAGPRGEERDLAAELDERARLRQLLEGLGSRLSPREREAAVLCYLQGLARSEAAAQLGMSERAFRKLMEGRGSRQPGVAVKVGELVEAIGGGRWCEQQRSLMRALAFGILDPAGERYPHALRHTGECPACRAYVASLRGLAAALPPALLPHSLEAGMLARLLGGAHGAVGAGAAGAGSSAGAGLSGGGAAASASAGSGVGSGAAAAGAGAGGIGASGGGWLLAGGSVGAKLAVGCVLALSVGAGCLALEHDAGRLHATRPRARSAAGERGPSAGGADALASEVAIAPAIAGRAAGSAASASSEPTLSPAAQANREFGLEGAPGSATAQARRSPRPTSEETAHVAEAGRAGAGAVAARAAPPEGPPSPRAEAQAEREFSPG